MKDVVLEIKNLKKSFSKPVITSRGKKSDKVFHILNGLNVSVTRGSITAIFGGNGTGKTTLFNILNCLLPADSGRVIYEGVDLLQQPAWEIPRQGIGRLFQGSKVFKEMTVLENMLIAHSNRNGELPFTAVFKSHKTKIYEKQHTEQVKQVFKNIFGANNDFISKLNDQAGTLSYGQQRLLSFARLFIGNYKLILLDEPTTGINEESIEQLTNGLRNFIYSGKTVFLIEHNMQVVYDIADYCYYLSDGKTDINGITKEVMKQPEVVTNYLNFF